ncbi:cytochrome P450 family protein [Striga asiatica]|uniref:Cytochrome P450 family protein n=1 Tax=Striga asiatica TaxID=4170 RepID=A0A5A7QIH1_STRAF|nr:cytochrome P450 family protein [Striga asiatica]
MKLLIFLGIHHPARRSAAVPYFGQGAAAHATPQSFEQEHPISDPNHSRSTPRSSITATIGLLDLMRLRSIFELQAKYNDVVVVDVVELEVLEVSNSTTNTWLEDDFGLEYILGPSGLDTLFPKIWATVRVHFKKHNREETTVGLYGLTRALTFAIVLECLLGIKARPGMLGTFERVLEGVFSAAVGFPWSKFGRASGAQREIERELLREIRKRREEIERGGSIERVLMSRLVEGLVRGEISEEEVVDNVVLLVFAAHDTMSFAIAMTFRMMARHPDCYSILEKEHRDRVSRKGEEEPLMYEDTKTMSYTWKVARESMRIFPPIFGSFRKAIQDIEYDGYTIPKGWKILWMAYGTHYDPECFEDPMAFNPDRFDESIQPYTFVPFGGGPRLCAGYQLAKLNILIFVHYVVTRYDWSLVLPDEPITIDPLPFPSQGMPVTIRPKVETKP